MRFRRLAVVTIAATFVLIAVGGLVRATDSGLGCPDWPRCFGRLVPPAELHAWIEHSHRLVASVVMVLVALLVVAAYRTGQERAVRRAAVAALVMVLAQALIGAFVVWWKLRADSVTLHLATALALVALLIYIGFRARYASDRSRRHGQDRGFVRLAGAGAGLLYLQMLVGSTVTGHHAGLAYPLNVLLPDLGPSVARIQLAHRALAMVVGALVLAIWVVARRTQRAHPTVTRLAGYAAGLVAVQIGLGLANVANRLSALTVVPHLAVGALLWGTMVALVLHADRFCWHPGPRPGRARAGPGPHRRPVGQGLLPADQAPHHRAAAGHHRPDDVHRRPRGAVALADGGHPVRRGPVRGQRERPQLLPGPRHRRPDAPHRPAAPARPPGRPGRRPALRARPGGGRVRLAVGGGQPALGRARPPRPSCSTCSSTPSASSAARPRTS